MRLRRYMQLAVTKKETLYIKEGALAMQFYNPIIAQQTLVIIAQLHKDFGIAGHSEDMTKIYIDPLVIGRMPIETLVAHETFEMPLVEILKFSYEWSHEQATLVEHALCDKLGIDWESYDQTFHEILKMQGDRNPQPINPSDIHEYVHQTKPKTDEETL